MEFFSKKFLDKVSKQYIYKTMRLYRLFRATILLFLLYNCNKRNQEIVISSDNIGERNLIYQLGDTLSASGRNNYNKNFKQILFINKNEQQIIRIGNGSEVIGARIEELRKMSNGWIIKRTPIKYDEKQKTYLIETSEGVWINYDSEINSSYYEYYWVSKNIDTIKGPFSMKK
ncbi:hypothetical protein [Chryseobacterium sp. MFBS3-17]|uniref:hypothetical protein n=1 Tax=Chryseobacterium sp. MFBS3-17 TaxID=2886689 RepID=UPI001D0DDBD2|nr:hypothetical protein [Chryseobacterium sp. MFBS3-17]MCC2590605.1 hypothetical protein [Chryseobacterium sp. MFBS3-17]